MYTQDQVNKFNKMFQVYTEYTSATFSIMTEDGIQSSRNEDYEISKGAVTITLPNGHCYHIDCFINKNPEMLAKDLFDLFIQLNENESAFEEQLKK